MKPILIIPDIHGRDFWKKPLEHSDDYSHIVFLGDYFDPYPREDISEEDAIDNFHQLTDALAKIPSERVTMLLGNHDAHYVNDIFYKYAGGTRRSSIHAEEITKLLNDYVSDQIAWECTVNGKRYLFTHAGVGAKWLSLHKDILKDVTASSLNHLTQTDEGWIALCDVGFSRGGFDVQGSPLWCDIDELVSGNNTNPDCPLPYQIVGHSQVGGDPFITDHVACLDTHKAYTLDDKGHIERA